MRALSRVFRGRDLGQAKPLAKIISDLWKNGEQGVLYDVEGFREAWNSVGPELLTGTWNFSPGISGTTAAMSFSSATNSAAAMQISAVNGEIYKVTFEITSYTSGAPFIAISQGALYTIPSPSSLGVREMLITSGGVDGFFRIYAGNVGVGGTYNIKNISVAKATGLDNIPVYQDVLGNIPCYMPGQGLVDAPVAMLLDKRKGFLKGKQLLSNTNFNTLTSWTAVRGATASASNGIVTVTTGDPNNWGSISTPLTTEPGKTYLVSAYATATGGQNVQLLISDSPVNHVNITNTGSSRNTIGYYSVVFKATSTTHYMWLGSSANSAGVAVSSWTTPTAREISPNYAYQATTTSRPTLSARYNLLNNTNFANAGLGSPGTAPTGWSGNFNTATITGITPIDNDYSIQITSNAQRLFFAQGFTAAVNTTYKLSCLLLENSGISIDNLLGFTGLPVGATLQWYINGVSSLSTAVPGPGSRIELWLVNSTTAGTPSARVGLGTATNSTGVAAFAKPDVRIVGDGLGLPNYQRAIDANTYDTVGFPLYLRFDGVDDGLMTPNIDFSGTSVAAAVSVVRKMADGTRGIIFELGSTGYGAPGSFNQEIYWFASNVSTSYSGTTGNATSTYSCTAPISIAISSSWDLTTPLQVLRVNGVQRSFATAASGGTFLNAPLFIGRRNNSAVPGNIRLYSILIRGVATSTPLITKIERYLNQKAKVY